MPILPDSVGKTMFEAPAKRVNALSMENVTGVLTPFAPTMVAVNVVNDDGQ